MLLDTGSRFLWLHFKTFKWSKMLSENMLLSFLQFSFFFFFFFFFIDRQTNWIGTEYSWLQAIYKIELGTLVFSCHWQHWDTWFIVVGPCLNWEYCQILTMCANSVCCQPSINRWLTAVLVSPGWDNGNWGLWNFSSAFDFNNLTYSWFFDIKWTKNIMH